MVRGNTHTTNYWNISWKTTTHWIFTTDKKMSHKINCITSSILSVPVIEDRTRRWWTFWHRRHSTGFFYSSITYTHAYGKTTGMPRKEVPWHYTQYFTGKKSNSCHQGFLTTVNSNNHHETLYIAAVRWKPCILQCTACPHSSLVPVTFGIYMPNEKTLKMPSI